MRHSGRLTAYVKLLPIPLEKFLKLALILARFAPFVRLPVIAVAPVHLKQFLTAFHQA